MAIVLLPAQVTGGIVNGVNSLTHSARVGSPFTMVLYGGRPDNTDAYWNNTTNAYSFGVSLSQLPPGLTLNLGGTGAASISGTPTRSGSFSFTVTAFNDWGSSSIWWWTRTSQISGPPATFTITVQPATPVITSLLSTSAPIEQAFRYQIVAANEPTSFNATGLPSGLSINTATGLISGTVTSVATYSVTITASNSSGSDSETLTITFFRSPPVITSLTPPTGSVGVAFSYQITASNSPTSYSATGLPGGLNLNAANGSITGTPTATGTFTATISASNSAGTGSAAIQISIVDLRFTNANSLTTRAETQTTFRLTNDFPNPALVSFTVAGAPSWLVLDQNSGRFSIYPPSSGVFTVVFTASASGVSSTQTFTITVNPSLAVVSWNLVRDTTTKCRMVYFQVSMASQIRQDIFSSGFDSVELRGEFSGWEPIPGVLLPVNGSTDGSSVYHFLAYIQGEPGTTLKYKFKATNSLDWESIPDRTFQLGPVSGSDKALQVIPRASFNNVVADPILVGTQSVMGVYLGSEAVSKLHLGEKQIFP